VLGPQGTLFFLLLIIAFAGLMAWLIRTRQLLLRVVAAILAFAPAMVFGIASVNKYFDYYQSWGAMFSDLSGQSVQAVPQVTAAGLGKGAGKSVSALLADSASTGLDSRTGYLFRTMVTGPGSRISREVYVWLPPQYFSKAYAHFRFPAVELLHGSPGNPESWVSVMNVLTIYLQELQAHRAAPAVLVMPDTDGGQQYSLQCLNQPGGLQDMTFVGREVPDWVTANLRVQRPGGMWGIAGYSEGGYCAANIALQYPTRFGFAGSLSGYFAPIQSQVPSHNKPGGTPVDVSPFARSARLLALNSPDEYVLRIPVGVEVPQFYLAAGALDQADVRAAEYFRQLLLTRVAAVPMNVVPGGGHQAMVWRAGVAQMLPWMTSNIFAVDQHYTAVQQRDAVLRARRAKRAGEKRTGSRTRAERPPLPPVPSSGLLRPPGHPVTRAT
jgi:enterochelin esterase-like enzyme